MELRQFFRPKTRFKLLVPLAPWVMLHFIELFRSFPIILYMGCRCHVKIYPEGRICICSFFPWCTLSPSLALAHAFPLTRVRIRCSTAIGRKRAALFIGLLESRPLLNRATQLAWPSVAWQVLRLGGRGQLNVASYQDEAVSIL